VKPLWHLLWFKCMSDRPSPRDISSFATERFLLKFTYSGLFYVIAWPFSFVQHFSRDISIFHFLPFLSSLSTYRGPETLCSWCKDPLGVRYYSGNRKASVLRRKWTFFTKFLRLQHQSPQYAALRSQYLSKISENAVPADLRDRLCYAPNCLLGKFLHWQSSRPSRPLSRPRFVQPVEKKSTVPKRTPLDRYPPSNAALQCLLSQCLSRIPSLSRFRFLCV